MSCVERFMIQCHLSGGQIVPFCDTKKVCIIKIVHVVLESYDKDIQGTPQF